MVNAAVEANFDGLVGPTHNYAGLAYGNVASAAHAQTPSNPREAALQGLAKMKALAELGIPQGVLPPHERPHLPTLRRLGFSGSDAQVLLKASREAPDLLAAIASASPMWTANAATVSPSADCADGKVHFTPANLATHLHRAIESETTARAFKAIFPDARHFVHHQPLPAVPGLGDEGAANHTRLCTEYGAAGLELFVYGRGAQGEPQPRRFPARQTRAACEAIARLHRLDRARCHFAQQAPEAIDAGVFHNDVIATGNRDFLLCHERAYVDPRALKEWILRHLPSARIVEIADHEVCLAEAVASYLFNSQLVSAADGMWLIVARECQEHPRVWACIQRMLADPLNPIVGVKVFDLRQSMRNGGGPACLRLRVVLNAAERAAVNPQVWLDAARHAELAAWVRRHYRDRLLPADLADPQLLQESRAALDELTRILGLGALYDFQR
jgi:succinylarginine dihydrolase